MQAILSETDIEALLTSEQFGHMACSDEGKPYIVPMAFVYHDDVLYGQTAEGKKINMLRKNPSVCFQVQSFADGAWRSVICHGTFEEMDFEALHNPNGIVLVKLLTERIAGIQGNVGVAIPFMFGEGAAPMTTNGKTSTLFRIVIAEKTGRLYAAQQ